MMATPTDGEFTPEFTEFVRRGVHRLFCTPVAFGGGKSEGRNKFHDDLAPALGDTTGEFPCLCSTRTVTYNGRVLFAGGA